MSIVRSEQASGRLEYQSPRLVAYGGTLKTTSECMGLTGCRTAPR
jgi:hypothetical protein